MSEKLNIYQRINKIMSDVKRVAHESKKVNGQYTFVSHDAVTSEIKPLLVKHGVVIVPKVLSRIQDGNRTEIDYEVTFVNIDNPEDRFSVNSFGYGIDNQDKGPGKAMSYAYKYALLKALALETGDDVEKDMIEHKENTLSEKQYKLIIDLCEQKGIVITDGVEKQIRSMSSKQASEKIKSLQERK